MGCTPSSDFTEVLHCIVEAQSSEELSRKKWQFEMDHPKLKSWEKKALDYITRGRLDELEGYPRLKSHLKARVY